ncbi:ABC-type Mn2+ and Zn2+ transport systems,permease components [Crocosphaera watsonii WH 0402]|uniref:ABC-type Mn2+ and Zn2+ transport systems,permease components n=2 Tax=Crocosphaera watsonii TaxID=263511 RepID=T2JMH5_CROWT|nr:metal ABC transporter permease [Crocosphaera watsonii]CCQ55384.1 Manganese ABC transporter, inner membrane permease protein SitD [Crocosphaera watsonii WH 0005]CCQ66266.1 ABC-type Mn2+ and Zn2+ transport systems,permease components [Crocosphaera watsonii WH 0402]
MNWFTEPLRYGFLVQAIWVSAFVGLVCAVLSCYITLKGWSLMGDAISHAVVPGVVIAYAINIPFAIGAFIFGFGATIAIGYIKSNTRLKEDAVIGIVFTGFFAFGLVIITKIPSNIDLFHILFGNVLGISKSDIIQTLISGIITLVIILLRRKDLLLFCFDPNHAKAIGLNTQMIYYTLLSVLALTIVAALQTAGIILVISMLVTPGSIGYLLSDRFDYMLIISVISSVFSCVFGTYVSYHLDVSTGGSIVVLLTLLFVLAMIFAPKYGILVQQLRKHTNQELDELVKH